MIDRYDAPEGMIAVRDEQSCAGCFYNNTDCTHRNRCIALYRKDDTRSIFVTRSAFEKMLLQEIEQFYGKGKVKRIVFTEESENERN